MRLLAIDPGSYECGTYDGVTPVTWVLGKRNKDQLSARLGALAEQLVDKLTEEPDNPYDFIVYEKTFLRGVHATAALNQVIGVIRACAHTAGVGDYGVDNGTLRKWATGTGVKQVKSKDDAANPMLRKAYLCIPRAQRMILDQHSADAVCLYNYTIEKGLAS